MTPCEKGSEISEIKTKVNDLEHIIKGNGKPGIQTNVITMLENQRQIGETLDEIYDSVQDLVNFRVELLAEKKIKDNSATLNRWLITTVVTLAGVIITLIVQQ